eukprot:scaffold9206_cov113-Isochrysis_galbana.AAC.7
MAPSSASPRAATASRTRRAAEASSGSSTRAAPPSASSLAIPGCASRRSGWRSFSSLSSSTHWPKPRVCSRVPATASSRRTTARVARTGVESSGRSVAGSAPAPSTSASPAMPAQPGRKRRPLSEGPGGFPAFNLIGLERSNANKNTNKKSFLVFL